jgi:hypothetical protein
MLICHFAFGMMPFKLFATSLTVFPQMFFKINHLLKIFFNSVPNYLFLKTFGCACWPNLRPYNSHKLQPRSLQCVFLGYNLLHHSYKCLHIPTSRLYISRDVIFLENLFPFLQNTSPLPTQPINFSGQSASLLGPCPLLC